MEEPKKIIQEDEIDLLELAKVLDGQNATVSGWNTQSIVITSFDMKINLCTAVGRKFGVVVEAMRVKA